MKISALVFLIALTAFAQTPASKSAKPPAVSPAKPAAAVKPDASAAKPAAPAAVPGPTPVGGVMDIMSAMTIPASEAIFAAGGDPPNNDMEWLTLQHNALILAESGNLLMIAGRAKDKGEWMTRARAMVNAGNAAYKAAQAKDLAKLGNIGDEQIYPICEACHKTYLKR
jgi:hypothetical protein